jgi:hypothetical protein
VSKPIKKGNQKFESNFQIDNLSNIRNGASRDPLERPHSGRPNREGLKSVIPK